MARPDHADPGAGDILGQFIGLIGEDATFRLLETAAGTRVYIPNGGSAETNLCKIVGPKAADILAARFGGDIIKLPLAKAWRARVYRERGLSCSRIALLIGCNESTVARHLQSMGLTRANRIAPAPPACAAVPIIEDVS